MYYLTGRRTFGQMHTSPAPWPTPCPAIPLQGDPGQALDVLATTALRSQPHAQEVQSAIVRAAVCHSQWWVQWRGLCLGVWCQRCGLIKLDPRALFPACAPQARCAGWPDRACICSLCRVAALLQGAVPTGGLQPRPAADNMGASLAGPLQVPLAANSGSMPVGQGYAAREQWQKTEAALKVGRLVAAFWRQGLTAHSPWFRGASYGLLPACISVCWAHDSSPAPLQVTPAITSPIMLHPSVTGGAGHLPRCNPAEPDAVPAVHRSRQGS